MKDLLNLGLQYFADDPAETTENDGGNENPVGEVATFEDTLKANKEYQAEFDRRIGKALETAREKWQTEQNATLEEKIGEAQKLAKMNAEQKAQYDRDKKEQELIEKEAEITKRELKLTAIDSLSEKGLPISLSECLVYTDAETCNKSIEAVAKAFEDAVTKAVDGRLRQSPPKEGGSAPAKFTTDQLKGKTVEQINALWSKVT